MQYELHNYAGSFRVPTLRNNGHPDPSQDLKSNALEFDDGDSERLL